MGADPRGRNAVPGTGHPAGRHSGRRVDRGDVPAPDRPRLPGRLPQQPDAHLGPAGRLYLWRDQHRTDAGFGWG